MFAQIAITVLGGIIVVAVIATLFRGLLTSPKEGTIIPVVKGGDDFYKFIDNVPGWMMVHVNESGVQEPKMVPGERQEDFLEAQFGAFMLGPIPYLYRQMMINFKWEDWEQKSSGGDYHVVAHQERVNSVFFQHPYAMRFSGLEDEDRQEIEIILQVTTRMIFPRRALFLTLPVGSWFIQTKARIQDKLRTHVRGKTFEALLDEDSCAPDDSIVDKLRCPIFAKEILDKYGIELVAIDVLEINLGEQDEDLQKAQTEAKLEDLRAKAKVIKAEADKKVRQLTEIDIEKDLIKAVGIEGYRALQMKNLTGTYIEARNSGDSDKMVEILTAVKALQPNQNQNPQK